MTPNQAPRVRRHRFSVRTVVVRLSRKLRATYRIRTGPYLSQLLLAVLSLVLPSLAKALPQGPVVEAGTATVNTPTASSMVINQTTPKAVLGWQSFSIGQGQSVQFVQPNAASVALNRVMGGDVSSIFGTLSANGQVFLLNPAGVMFAPGAQVNVGGLVASTLNLSNADFMAGKYQFGGTGGSVVNYGNIQGGYVVLAAPNVANHGTISAPGGSVGLLAGSRVTVDPTGGGLVKFSVDAAAVNAVASNTGTITVDGGKAAILVSSLGDTFSTVLNQSGVIRANSIANQNGMIVLDGGASGIVQVSGTLEARGAQAGETGGTVKVLGERVGLMTGAKIDASGDAGGGTVLVGGNFQGKGAERNATVTLVHEGAEIDASATSAGNGGKVIVWADGTTRYAGAIKATGGAVSGDGGFAEVSGKQSLDFTGGADLSASAGNLGTLLLDPLDIVIATGGGATPVAGYMAYTENSGGTSIIAPSTLQGLNAAIQLQATRDIIINNDITLNNQFFTAQAGNSVNVNANINTGTSGMFLNANYRHSFFDDPSGTGIVNVAGGTTLTGSFISFSGAGAATNVLNGNIAATAGATFYSNTQINGTVSAPAVTVHRATTLGSANRIADTAALTIESGATLNLSAVNDTVASLTLNGGTLSGTGTLTTASGATLNAGTINANLGGTAAITKATAGTVTLNGTAAATTINVNGGTLNLGPTANRLAGGGAAITIAIGATLNTGAAAQNLGGGTATVVNNGALVTGAAIAAASVAGTGTASLGGAVTTAGTQTYGAVTLTSDVVLDAGSLTVNGTVSGANTLSVLSAGATVFNDAVNIASLVTDLGGTISLKNVTTSGQQLYRDDATLNGAYQTTNSTFGVVGTTTLAGTSSVSTGSGLIHFGSTVVGTLGTESLSTTNTGTITLGGGISNLTNLTIAGGPTAVVLPTTTLTGTLLVASAGGVGQTGALTAAVVRGTSGGQFNLNNAGNAIGSLQNISGSSVAVNDSAGGLSLTNAVTATTGSVSIQTSGGTLVVGGNVQAAGNVVLTSQGAAGDIISTGGGTVTATTGFVELNAGRNMSLGAALSAAGAGGTVGLNLGGSAAGAFSTTATIASNAGTTITGGGNNDSFNFSGAPAFSATILGQGGVNTLTGRNTGASYTLTGANAGTGDGLTFSGISTLTGGTANDTFTLAAGVPSFNGSIAGGGGTDTLAATDGTNAWAITGPNVGTLNTSTTFSAITNLTGGSGTDTLTGRNNATAWSVTGAKAVTVEGLNATNTEALVGGTLNDTFTLAAATPTFNGSIAGGGGTDTLAATDGTNAWAVTGANAGTLNTSTTFSAITNLAGGTGADTFTFADAGSVTGTVAGGGTASVDAVDLSAKTGLVAINTQTGVVTGSAGTSGIEAFIGNGASTTLTSAALSLTGANSGVADAGIAYSGVANLQGAAVANTIAGNGGSVTGTITDGGAGATLSGTITSGGAQTYNGPVTLGADTTLAASSVNLTGTVGGATRALIINSSGATTLGGSVTVAALTTDAAGSTSIAADVSTSGTQSFGDVVTLTADVVLASSGGGAISFGNTINGAQALTVNTAGATTFGGAVGATTALTSLTTNAGGTTSLGGNVTTTGAQSYGDNVTAGSPVTIASTGGGNVSLLGALTGGGFAINTTGTIIRPAVVAAVPTIASAASSVESISKVDVAGLTNVVAATQSELTGDMVTSFEEKVWSAKNSMLQWSFNNLQRMMTPLNFGTGTIRRPKCTSEQSSSGDC